MAGGAAHPCVLFCINASTPLTKATTDVRTLTTPSFSSSLSTAQATSTAAGARSNTRRGAPAAAPRTHVLFHRPAAAKQDHYTKHAVHSSTMSGFFLRIANYIANELIVKGLANNRSFQRFALRTADHVEKVKVTGAAHTEKIAKEAEKQVGVAGRFLGAFQKEIEKDMKKFAQPKRK